MSIMELFGLVAIMSGALVALWTLLRKAAGTPTQLTKEQLEALDGAVILLADDSVTIQKVVELTFMDAPVRLICAANGKSATELLEKQKFDVVIADVHMPVRTGYEVCKYAKRLDPEVPVLLLVGTFEPFNEDLYSGCGADEILKKPFNSVDLMRTTSRLLLQKDGDHHVE